MGIVKTFRREAEAWNRRRQLKRGVSKSFYEHARQGMEQARPKGDNWFERMQKREGKRAKRRVFWREGAGKLFGGLNTDAQNFLGKPLKKRIERKMRIGKRGKRHSHRKHKEPSLI